MSTTTTAARLTIEQTIIAQIGRGNVLAISGGRVHYGHAGTVVLPVRYGYAVEVTYCAGSDTYTVVRTFTRGMKRWIKREWTRVYCDELGEIAYRASCYLDD